MAGLPRVRPAGRSVVARAPGSAAARPVAGSAAVRPVAAVAVVAVVPAWTALVDRSAARRVAAGSAGPAVRQAVRPGPPARVAAADTPAARWVEPEECRGRAAPPVPTDDQAPKRTGRTGRPVRSGASPHRRCRARRPPRPGRTRAPA